MRVFDKIVPFLDKSVEDIGSFILVDDKKLPLDSFFFKEIVPSVVGTLVFVDGGNGEILRSPSISLQFVRLAAVFFKDNVRVNKIVREFFVLVSAEGDSAYRCRVFDLNGEVSDSFVVDAFDSELRQGSHRVSAGVVGSHVRKLAEIRFASELVSGLDEGSVLVRDGDLSLSGPFVGEVFSSLSVLAKSRGVRVVGLSKSCSLCSDSGVPAVFAVSSIAPVGVWFYFANNNVGFVKLHSASRYVFRFDVFSHDVDFLHDIFSLLSSNSCDPVFLGYPFGLVEVDKFARVSSGELSQLKLRFFAKFDFSGLESSLNAHDVLNTL
ncbi:hypothetical protein DRJ22_03465 [Candidatus Woesearchaeota archaeon]|nr:MAG: hypothetical protein DRJ22_03465 [Candidatus Woesearchaeota archaeon]